MLPHHIPTINTLLYDSRCALTVYSCSYSKLILHGSRCASYYIFGYSLLRGRRVHVEDEIRHGGARWYKDPDFVDESIAAKLILVL